MPAAAPAVKPDNRQLINEDETLTAEDQQALASEAEPAAPSPPQALPEPPGEHPVDLQAPVFPPQPGQPQPPKGKKPEEAIPYERFREVYEDTKRKDKELADMRDRWARLEERQNLAREAQARFEQQQALEAQRARVPEKPDGNVDPYGAALWERDRRIETLQSQLEQVAQNVGLTNQQMQQSTQMNDFNLWLTNDISNYRSRQTDYDQAAQHARTARVGFWQSVGLPPEQAEAIVNNEAFAIAYAARLNGKSAAQAYYDAAKVMGYQGAQQNGAPAANGAPAPAPQAPNLQDKMAQLKKGQAAQGLSRAPVLDDNNANWSNLSAQQIADMDENDFVEALQDPARAQQLNKVLERLEGLRQ